MPQQSSPPTKTRNLALENFSAKLVARLIVVFISLTQVGARLYFSFAESELTGPSMEIYFITMPLLAALAIMVLIKFFIYKRLGPLIFKYTTTIDIIFCLVFTAEWMTTLYAALIQGVQERSICYSISAIFRFTSFSWRTALQTFVTQHWYFKIIPPVCAFGLITGFAIINDIAATQFILIRGLLQVSYVILIFYLESKINFKLMLGKIYQEQWVQINEFILNNIPENIAILDLEGNIKYTSEYFKRFREGSNSSSLGKLFNKIRNLQQQQTEIDALFLDLNIKPQPKEDFSSDYILNSPEDHKNDMSVMESLDTLIEVFKALIVKGNIEEKSFFIFNGKLDQEGSEIQRSIEVKISFIRQYCIPYIVIILRDTTQRDHILTLESNIKYKDNLLASVSHELRTPLNGNMNLVEAAINSDEVSPGVKEGLLVPALRSSKFLLHLVNDILDMSQIRAQKLRLVFHEANLKETFCNTIQLLELHARTKDIRLELSLDTMLPTTLCTDHIRLSQIVLNLINNSIKFTKQGYVRLTATPEELNLVKVTVEDTGIGMSGSEINKLFQDFTHIESKERERMNPTGVGLGLKIAYNLAKLLGPAGNRGITVRSTPQEGSTFSFLIEDKQAGVQVQEEEKSSCVSLSIADEIEISKGPSVSLKMLKRKSIQRSNKIGSPLSRALCSCAKILAIDDDPFNMLAYEVIFKSLDIKIDRAYNGKNAVDKILNRIQQPCTVNCSMYCLVIVDQEMPGMSGPETVREIRKQTQGLSPPVNMIGCTANHDDHSLEEFMKSGIVECIQKPVSNFVIRELLRKYQII